MLYNLYQQFAPSGPAAGGTGKELMMPSTKQVPVRRRERIEPHEVEPLPTTSGGGEELIDGIDELLDEIDGLLEEQAVLTRYRQRPGQ